MGRTFRPLWAPHFAQIAAAREGRVAGCRSMRTLWRITRPMGPCSEWIGARADPGVTDRSLVRYFDAADLFAKNYI